MSIGGLDSYPSTLYRFGGLGSVGPFAAPSANPFDPVAGAVQGDGLVTPGTPWSNPAGQGTISAPSGVFQSLTADIQALLIQAQSGATSSSSSTSSATQGSTATSGDGTAATASTAATTGTSSTPAANPAAQIISDLQTLLAGSQSGQGATTQNSQTGTPTSIDPTSEARPHHHRHHHHGGGGEASATSASSTEANQSAGSDTFQTASISSGSADASVARSFAADIVQAIQSYAGGASTASTSSSVA